MKDKTAKHVPLTDKILAVLDSLPEGERLSKWDLSEKLGAELSQVEHSCQHLMHLGHIVSERKGNRAYYELTRRMQARQRTVLVNRANPVCASAMPNGDLSYWKKYVTDIMTPARVGAQPRHTPDELCPGVGSI